MDRSAMTPSEDWPRALALLTATPSEPNSAMEFACAAFETAFSYQVSWRATGEAIVDNLCNRFATKHDVFYEMEGEDAVVHCESAPGQPTVRLALVEQLGQDIVVASVAALIGLATLALEPLNDGDDLHFLLVTSELYEKLQSTVGTRFGEAMRYVVPISSE